MPWKLSKIVSFILLLSVFALKAGKEVPSLAELQKRYPSQNAVYLTDKEHLFITTKKDEYKVWSDYHWQIQLLSDQGMVYSDHSLHYSKFTSVKNIQATSYIPKEKPGKYKKIKVENFEVEDVMSSGVFYDDSKQISFNYPGAQEGAIFDLQYQELINDPKFIGKFYFVSHIPSLEVEYSVTFPENVKIHYELFNTDKINLEFSEIKKGKNTTYTWKVKNVDPYASVPGAPGFSYYAPHIIVRIGEIQLKTKKEVVLPNADALYDWYYSLVKDVNKEEDEHLKTITDSLVNGINSKDEKARLIFNWVQDNIKYVAFEDGMGGFVPRQASNVCVKRYGDCKDMASIITTMLKYAGVEAHLTWVGYRKIPYKYTELPTPHVDNHMIASYKNDKDETVFLDAVGSYTPYGYPTGFIQGKQTMIGIDEGKYELVEVPIIPRKMNLHNDSVFIQFDGDKLKGRGVISAKGYAKLDYVYPLINKTADKRTERLEAMLEKGNNKFKLQKSSFDGMSDRDKDLIINYDFTLEDYAQNLNNEIFVNLNLDKDFMGSKLDVEKRKGISYEFDYKMDDTNVVVFEIPKGYKLSYLPEASSFKKDNFGYEISYTQSGNKVIMKKNVYVDLIMLEEADFEEWNKMIKGLKSAYKESIILKK